MTPDGERLRTHGIRAVLDMGPPPRQVLDELWDALAEVDLSDPPEWAGDLIGVLSALEAMIVTCGELRVTRGGA